ncbi:MAG TPA: cupin domain-containing protein [Solirubrobacteraceae bacterium]|jgi:quercetin dioxygenase-like cupin family protein
MIPPSVHVHAGAAETGGAYVLAELLLPPGAVGPGGHDPEQRESLEVLCGRVALTVDGVERLLDAGEIVRLDAGRRRQWRNAGAGLARVLVEYRPARAAEALLAALIPTPEETLL